MTANNVYYVNYFNEETCEIVEAFVVAKSFKDSKKVFHRYFNVKKWDYRFLTVVTRPSIIACANKHIAKCFSVHSKPLTENNHVYIVANSFTEVAVEWNKKYGTLQIDPYFEEHQEYRIIFQEE